MPTRAASAEPSRSPVPGPALRRRTALGGLVALGTAVTGCSGGTDRPAAPGGTRSGSSSPAATATDPDVALAAAALASERHVLAMVRAALHRHRDQRELLRATRDVHLAHVRLLADAVPGGAPSTAGGPVPVPAARPEEALRAVARAEDRLAESNRRSAFHARSGAFARVLASMAAAAGQQSAVLRAHTGGRPGR